MCLCRQSRWEGVTCWELDGSGWLPRLRQMSGLFESKSWARTCQQNPSSGRTFRRYDRAHSRHPLSNQQGQQGRHQGAVIDGPAGKRRRYDPGYRPSEHMLSLKLLLLWTCMGQSLQPR